MQLELYWIGQQMNFNKEKEIMLKRIAESIGFAFGTCLKFYLFSATPTVWVWMPFLALEKMHNITVNN